MLRSPNLVEFISCLKYLKDCIVFQVDPFSVTLVFIQKIFLHFLDLHLKSIVVKVMSYIKDTNDFLRKLQNLPKLPYDVILCTIDVVGLYSNIPNDESLLFLKRH